jgi:hypothetical protein
MILSGEKITAEYTFKEVEEPLVFLDAYPAVEACIRSGGRIHAFRSGGGLRVLRLEQDERLKAYGEHPHVEVAFRHLEEGCAAGGRPYGEVYGTIYDNYWTGSTTTSSSIDRFLRMGRSFDIFYKRRNAGLFVCRAEYLAERHAPEWIGEYVMKYQVNFQWETSGHLYEASPFVFPGNGEQGWSVRCLTNPKGVNWSYNGKLYITSRTFKGILSKMEGTFASTFEED